jgi:RNA polymerase sigma factor (sigma-70 family)
MAGEDWLSERFAEHRARLQAIAYRMLGSPSEAEDAVQEAWLRASRADASAVENLAGWLTTVVARVCLNMLEARRSRPEDSAGIQPPEPAPPGRAAGPEDELLLADSVGVALLVVLDTLAPAERLAFVLHDVFDVPFGEIAGILGRTPAAARQLASRARRRVQGASAAPELDLPRRQRVVAAFLAASRGGDFRALLALLAPEAVLRADPAAVRMGAPAETRGAAAVARVFAGRAQAARPALVDGIPAAIWAPGGRPRVVFAFTISGGKITGIGLTADPDRLGGLDIVFGVPGGQ